MSDYTPAANALAATEQASALDAEERKQTAYNIFSQTYGKALAGDPDTAKKIQDYQQNELLNPIAVKQANSTLTGTDLDNSGKVQTQDYNALANPLKLTGLADTNANTEATTDNTRALTNKTNTLLPGEVAQQGATLGQTRAQTGLIGAETAHTNVETAQGRQTLSVNQAGQDRGAALGLLTSLQGVAQKGGDVNAAFQAMKPQIAKFTGVTPDHLDGLGAAIAKDPNGTITNLMNGLNAAGAGVGGKGGGGAPLSLSAVDYAAQQFRLTGKMPALGNGSAAARAQVLNRAAQQAQQEGKGAEADALNQQSMKMRQTYLTDLAKSTPTSAGGLVRSAGAVLSHIDTLDSYIGALGNGNLPLANRLRQEFAQQTGKPAPVSFDAQKTIVGDEITRYLIARGGTGKDREALQAGLNKANSPAQLRSVISTYREDIGAQLGAQRQQAEGIGATAQFDSILPPRARALIGQGGGGGAPAGGNAGWSIQRVGG